MKFDYNQTPLKSSLNYNIQQNDLRFLCEFYRILYFNK